MRILMVCLGNICRSPIAEGILQHMVNNLGLNWLVDSAGTISLHAGESPHRLSLEVCQKNGIDISYQKARQFTMEDFEKFDRIYAMSEDVYCEIERLSKGVTDMTKVDLFLNEFNSGCNESVPDPWYGGKEDFAKVYEMIEKTCESIIKKYH